METMKPTARSGKSPSGSYKLPPTAKPAPLFRKIDWFTLITVAVVVMVGYWLTIAPDLTLEDSGELATGSLYAGIPHPPGYPVWTLYTYLWANFIPIHNVAWRVAMGEAFAGALACGLLGFIVSRGSSMMIESIESLKNIDRRWENAVCMVSGFVAGLLLAFNGYMWSQSVIVEVYAFSLLSFMGVLVFLLRWMYAPYQRRYLYWAFFIFGICFTNHQTLIVAAMGLEVAIAATDFKMGRNLFLWNSIAYLCGLILWREHMLFTETTIMVFTIFNVVGVCSMVAYAVFAVMTKETFLELCRDFCLLAFFAMVLSTPSLGAMGWFLALAALAGLIKLGWDTRKQGLEWLVVLACGALWGAGAAFYLYMPLAGMSTPPMQWGYPRTVEGFIHALTRGQYEKITPTDIFSASGFVRFLTQLGIVGGGVVDEFNWVYSLLALVPFLFITRMQKRERAWMFGLTGMYLCLAVLLVVLVNPSTDRQSVEISRVIFTASHVLVVIMIGYALTLISASLLARYRNFRPLGLLGGGIGLALALYTLAKIAQEMSVGLTDKGALQTFFHSIRRAFEPHQYGLPIFAGLLLFVLALGFLITLLLGREKPHMGLVLALFTLMPLTSIMSHWADNEQRNHLFGYWFGHDMFTPPFVDKNGKLNYNAKERAQLRKDPAEDKITYPEMARNAILYGGTDPGRFCPTYMIFCESFIPPKDKPHDPDFDRRDVYIITQNALADGTYLEYIRSQYNKTAQIPYDTPFFEDCFQRLFISNPKEREYRTNAIAKLAYDFLDKPFIAIGNKIEKNRRTGSSLFHESDFKDPASFARKLKDSAAPAALSKYLHDNLSPQTQKMLDNPDDKGLPALLARDLNRLIEGEYEANRKLPGLRDELASLTNQMSALRGNSGDFAKKQERAEALRKEIAAAEKLVPLYEPERFKDVALSEHVKQFIEQKPQLCSRIRLSRLLLEEAYPKEIAKSPGGVYPDLEMYIASPEDSQRCFQEYMADAQRRMQLGQLRPGEDVHVVKDPNGVDRVQVSGQVAVMAINGLLAKVMFDRNPSNEFYVEESFPLEWMYPHLTPFGIIMKINRQKLPSLSEDVLRRDHEFWAAYSERLIGNWITDDTPVKDIVDFVEKVYLRRDFTGFKGDRKFVRDDQAQKAFSKLRSSIAGIYAWRLGLSANFPTPPEYLPKTQAERERYLKEADFAFKQAFAFCPYSPEAVFRYIQVLLGSNKADNKRLDDAILVVNTALKLDPYNKQLKDTLKRLQGFKNNAGKINEVHANIAKLQQEVKQNPSNFQAALNLAGSLFSLNQTAAGVSVLDGILKNPHVTPQAVIAVAQYQIQTKNYAKLEQALQRLTEIEPNSPEAWYDLAALKASLGKGEEATKMLQKTIALSDARQVTNSKARDLRAEAAKDPRFKALSQSAEFKALISQP